jgi:hypothetical protein
VTIPRLHVDDDNVLLRLKFLNDEISEAEFKTKLQRAEKRQSKAAAIRTVLEMFVAATSDILLPVRNEGAARRALREIEELRAYVDTELGHIGKRYNSTAPTLKKLITTTD